MALIDFINQHDIDLKALERMRKRIFVLGRFNNKPLNDGIAPDLYLFTNRTDISDTYKDNFKSHRGLDYSNFVDAIKPRIAEKKTVETAFVTKEGIPVPVNMVQLDASDTGDEGDSYVINALNYFFLRAVSSTKQKQLLKDLPNLPELIDEAAGKTIYNQLRTNLTIFSSFQPRTVELIDAIAKLFAKCTGRDAIPPSFVYGERLPVKFSQKLIDYLYDEEGPEEFQLDDLGFSVGVWSGFVQPDRSKRARKALSDIVKSFKNELLGYPPQFNGINYTDGNLSVLTKQAIPDDLKKEFRKSKDAFNMLRQIMRSKVLLSMIVEWILSDLRDLPSVRDLPSGTLAQNQAIENAILRDWEYNNMAKPIRRPNKNERRDFSLSMGISFDKLMHAILSDDKEKIDALSPELKELADELLKDEEKIESIKAVSNYDDPEKFEAFKGALEIVFIDLISPLLYKEPGLDLPELKKRLRSQTMSAYLSAIMLSEEHMDAFKSIVTEDFLEYFYEKVDEEKQTINDKDEVLTRLMRDVVDVMTQDEIRASLEEGVRILKEISAIKENVKSVGEVAPTLPEKIEKGTLSESERNQEEIAKEYIIETITTMVEQKKSNLIANAAKKSEPEADGAPQNGDPNLDEVKNKDSNLSGDESKNQKLDNDEFKSNELEEKIDLIVNQFLPTEVDPSRIDEKELVKKAFSEFEKSHPNEIYNLAKDLSSYQQIMHLIYTRYKKNPQAKKFRSSVEGMTLMTLMDLFQDDLGFGKAYSNLYDLLIDLVIHLNVDDPEASPKKFLQEKTLTKYFDDSFFDYEGKGYAALMNILDAQGKASLQNVVHFVSELRGVKYLMDLLKDYSDVEVIVVNATAVEFMNWLKTENLTPDFSVNEKYFLRFRAGFLVKGESDKMTPPGLMYVTDLAFPQSLGNAHSDKLEWIQSMREFEMKREDLAYILPPTVVSTSVMARDMQWYNEGKELAIAASEASAPIFIVGPSPRLNEDKAFPTILPAGYPFCVHYLTDGRKKQDISIIGGAGGQSEGRFRVMGRGAVNYEKTMEEVIWGNENDSYCFAADYYLYLIVQLLATAKYKGYDKSGVDAVKFYSFFWDGVTARTNWNTGVELNNAIIGNKMLRFVIEHLQDMQDPTSTVPLVKKNPQNTSEPFVYELTNVRIKFEGDNWRSYSNIKWFEKVRAALDLL